MCREHNDEVDPFSYNSVSWSYFSLWLCGNSFQKCKINVSSQKTLTHLFIWSLCSYTSFYRNVNRWKRVDWPVSFISLPEILTLPRSRMKQSPWLKLSQVTGTSVALTTRRPLTWSTRCTTTSLVTTCLNPDATPPFWGKEKRLKDWSQEAGFKWHRYHCICVYIASVLLNGLSVHQSPKRHINLQLLQLLQYVFCK